jgi:Cytochrome c3
MGQASLLPSKSSILSAGTLLTYRDGPYLLRIEQKDGQEVYSASNGQNTISVPVLWAFGLGNAGQTYIFEREGTYYESRVSYYNQIQDLDLTTGHPRQSPSILLEALGRPISKDEMTKCFACHTSEDIFNGKLQIDQLRTGVTCENCHGPGSEHLKAVQLEATQSDVLGSLNIFNPAKLEPVDVNDFCGTCHRSTQDVLASRTRGILNLRFQPYRLENSRCYDPTDKRITCLACHDPHVDLGTNLVSYDSKCLACHARRGDKTSATRKAPACPTAASNCASCHMPKLDLPGTHYKFTDHYIRVDHPGKPYPD